MTQRSYDLVVIGAGPGGYVAAIRAAQLGLEVACIDKASQLGGTCLRVGCIPSKALLEASERFAEARHGLGRFGVRVPSVELDLAAMMRHKTGVVDSLTRGVAHLFKKNGIERYQGQARFLAPGEIAVAHEGSEVTLTAKHVLIATGSEATSLPGVALDGDRIGSSTEALGYEEVPQHLVVIGAGYIGLELGSVWARLGARVTVLEYLDRVLPGMDAEIASEALKLLKRQGLEFRLGSKVTGARVEAGRCVVEVAGSEQIDCDRVLVATGRRPYVAGLGLASIGLELDERGRIPVDAHFATGVAGVYAIGDVIGGAMLAHKAEDEGMACVEGLVRGYAHVNYDAIPGVVYTHPEIASVGKTEEQLVAQGVPFKKALFPFAANGRAKALNDAEGRVKMLAHGTTDRLLGVHIIGPRAGDLIAEAVLALECGASAEDLARTSHAHPTLAEALREAALALGDGPIHL